MPGRKLQNLLSKLLLIIAVMLTTNASATDLLDAYQLGMQHDPTYQAAVANYLATKEASPQAWAAIFPQITAETDVSSLRTYLLKSNTASMNSYTLGANLSQVVFDWGVFNRIRQARSIVKQATYTLAAAKQDLMLRVARAYFNVLLAQDDLSYTKKQRDGALQQLDETQERFKVGHATITTLEQFQGQYELLRAQTDTDTITLSSRLEQLGEIIGRQFGDLTPLKNHFVLENPNPAQLTLWQKQATEMNLSLEATRFGLIAARRNIQIMQAGHLPTLGAIASYADSKTPSVLNTIRTETTTVGLNLNFPIFSGGAVSSEVREARAQLQLATAEFEQAYRSALSEATQAYEALLLGMLQLSADRRTVEFNQSALGHVLEGYTAGIQTSLEVIQQQTRLLGVQRTYARDRYTYLTNMLLLQQAVGILKPESLAVLQTFAIQSRVGKRGVATRQSGPKTQLR